MRVDASMLGWLEQCRKMTKSSESLNRNCPQATTSTHSLQLRMNTLKWETMNAYTTVPASIHSWTYKEILITDVRYLRLTGPRTILHCEQSSMKMLSKQSATVINEREQLVILNCCPLLGNDRWLWLSTRCWMWNALTSISHPCLSLSRDTHISVTYIDWIVMWIDEHLDQIQFAALIWKSHFNPKFPLKTKKKYNHALLQLDVQTTDTFEIITSSALD